jgi:hypothetical protein
MMKKYENNQDVMEGKWTIARTGDEVIVDCSYPFKLTINRPAADTWKYMKDFNLWMEDLRWNSVVGDEAEGGTVYFTISEKHHEHYRKAYGFDPKGYTKTLTVRRTDPEKLIVLEELSADRRKIVGYYIWALSEHEGRTTVTGLVAYAPQWEPKTNEEQIRASFQSKESELEERWRTAYFPRLRQLVEGG